MSISSLIRFSTAGALYFCFMTGVLAYESDQYTNRLVAVPDSLEVMDQKVNEAIASVASRWDTGRNDKAFARAIYHELGGWYWVDRIERWAAGTDRVKKYPQTRYRSIYRGLPVWVTRVNFFFGVGRTFRVNGVIVGSDKFGHFFSQGYKYYKRELKGWDDERLLRWGAFAERWLFGQFTTGIYANADLVANYEGMRFYESLFLDDVVEGKSAILEWRNGRPVQIRPFTWADHINDYWDEALNPSFVVPSLNRRLRSRIQSLCPEYVRQPDRFVSKQDAVLWQRYRRIGLKDMRENQFSRICGPAGKPRLNSRKSGLAG